MAHTTTTNTPTVGAVIRAWRVFRGLSSKALAEKAEVRPGYLSEVENDKKRNPWLGHLEKLAAALGISLQDIHDRNLPPRQGAAEDDQALGQGPQASASPVTGMAGAPQPPAMAALWSVVQQILEHVQALTTAVSQLQADLADLKQAMGIHSPVSQPVSAGDGGQSPVDQSSADAPAVAAASERKGSETVEDILRAMEPAVIQATVKPIEPWGETPGPTPDWDKAEKWDEECTLIEEEPGELMVLMKGLQGVTLDHSHYQKRVTPILKGAGREADFMRRALARRARRKAAFEKHVKKHLIRHIMPIGALHWYKDTGFHRLDDWARHFEAPPATPQQQIADLRSIIHLLNTCPKYHLGLLTEENAEINFFFNHFFWEVKGRQTLLLTDKEIVAQVGLTARERNYIIRDKEIVDKFCTDFERLWTHTSVVREKDKVIYQLNKHIKLLEELKKSSVISEGRSPAY